MAEWTPELLLEHLKEIIRHNDAKYSEQFMAAEKAVATALVAQEKAITAAMAAQEKAVNAALTASEKAISIAEVNSEKWRNNANEWRGAMNDRERNFASTVELTMLKERVDKYEGEKGGYKSLGGLIAAAAAFIVAALTIVNILVGK